MLSSPSEDGSDALFPSADDPPTPQNNDVFTQLRQAELSPPSSQDPPGQNGAAPTDDLMDVAEVQENEHANGGGGPLGMGPPLTVERDAEKEPGYAWKNAKAREEHHRFMEQVMDKNFNLRMHLISDTTRMMTHDTDNPYIGEFGDPFDESKQQGNGLS